MEIRIPEPERHPVIDFDIVLDSGVLLTYTLDPEKGDTLTEGDTRMNIYLAPKTSKGDPTKTVPAEEITVFIPHIMTITRRERLVADATVEDQLNWLEAFKGGSVN